MAWVTPHDFTYQESITSTIMDGVKDNLLHLGELRPHVRATDASRTHGSTGTWQNVAWDGVSPDVGSMYTVGQSYLRLTQAGFWLVGAGATAAVNASGSRALMLGSAVDGGGTVYAQQNWPSQSGSAAAGTVVTMIQATANLDVYLSLYQGSGGSLTFTLIHMWAIWMTT